MKHLIICPEYPPAPIPPGGIGTYVFHISRLLAEIGETVHVIGQLWEGAAKKVEENCHGRQIIHRVPLDDWKSSEVKGLFQSDFPPQCFSWQAGLLAERLVEQEGIDIIEAQDYEAPLYYLQLRRALGLGPKMRPPCIVHLHSPTEFIVRYNDWDINDIYFRTAKRFEDYTIAAADVLLCPSRHLARRVEVSYGLAEGSIRIIPLPIGDFPLLEREKDTWEHGTICYVGRLQRLKGVIEWIDAAVAVAHGYPTAHFEFIGTNLLVTDGMSGEEFVERRIPKDMKMRFHFRGEQKHSSLPQFLARARIAVVPSRWENFPNTCIEAMCSGLPVIALSEGGPAEMIEDGRTGWLANKPGSGGLADALRRALETPPMKIAEMGHEASAAIRKICDNKKIVESHLNFRRQIVNQGAKRSLCLSANLPGVKRPLSDESVCRTSQNNFREGLAVVITCFNTGQFLGECLQSLKQQTRKPAVVVIVDDGSTEEQTLKALNHAQQEGWQVIHKRNEGLASTKNTGIEAVLGSGLNPIGFAFLNAEDRLQAGFVAACESVLQRCPEVGLVSCWVRHSGTDDSIWIKPCPSFPYQWLSNEATSFSAIRTEALHEAGNFRLMMSRGYEDWDLFNAVIAAGWVAVTIPAILGNHRFREDLIQHIMGGHSYKRMRRAACRSQPAQWSRGHSYKKRMRRELLERFPNMIARDAKDIILLTESDTAQLLCEMEQMMLNNHQGAALQILRKVKRKILRRTPAWLSHFVSRLTR